MVLDTNVLLNLYNFQGQALAEFTDVFRAIGDRLFVPHQALDEFWRNRLRVLKENQGKHLEREQIEKSFDDVEAGFRRWHQRVVDRLSPPEANAMRELAEAREALLIFMDDHRAEAETTRPDTPTYDDLVLQRLEPILDGKVGAAPTNAERSTLVAEGKRRIADKVPPGYMDAEKNPDRAVGDFMVWHQTMTQAKERLLPVLLVTNDQKEDWLSDRGTAAMRARPELVEELREFAGQPLLMMRSRELIELGELLGVQVSRSTLTEAGLADAEDTGWTAELADDYLRVLSNWPAHFRIFLEAVSNGGTISREHSAKLLGKDPQGGMQGSGKPFATAARRVAQYHKLDYEPTLPLGAGYEVGGWMSEFVMPPELRAVFVRAVTKFDADDVRGEPEELE